VLAAGLAIWGVSATPGLAEFGPVLSGLSASEDVVVEDEDASDVGETIAPQQTRVETENVQPPRNDKRSTATAPAVGSGGEAAFLICGPDTGTERAIENLIAGRTSFSSTLKGGADGCAQLTIRVDPNSQIGAGRQSSRQTVSVGAGRTVFVQIVSEGGLTRASIGYAA
jgi:hypothetical protein